MPFLTSIKVYSHFARICMHGQRFINAATKIQGIDMLKDFARHPNMVQSEKLCIKNVKKILAINIMSTRRMRITANDNDEALAKI
jgi:hypothetical protein